MLQKITLNCRYEGEAKANYNWGSLLHGFLMQMLPVEAADLLHISGLRPYSQYVTSCQTGKLSWHLGLWDVDVAQDVVAAVLPLARIHLEQKGLVLEVEEVQQTRCTDEEFFANFFTTSQPCRRYEIEFITPCSHKQNGNYVLFPSSELIMTSLSRRYSAFTGSISLDAPEVVAELARHARIVRYSLRSAVYYLENIKITGYMGKITICLNGPEQLVRLSGALLSFSEYSGIGIKTALGMGGVKVSPVH